MFGKNIKRIFSILVILVGMILLGCSVKDRRGIVGNVFNGAKIILPQNQTLGQSLSVVVKNKNGNVIVFDGGRVEDAKHLVEIIKENGCVVDAWFLTHIHDDHIGALYQILNDKLNEIQIKELHYKFAPITWYYDKIGEDAGAVLLFEETLKKYNEFMENNNKECVIKIFNDEKKDNRWTCSDIVVRVVNDIYLLDDDPINNSSIVYKVDIEDKKMMIFGDLAYYGGEALLKEKNIERELKSDIVVMAHHGQNGVDKKVYEMVSPIIAIWGTTEKIYNNANGKYKTDETKKWLSDIGVKRNYVTYEKDVIID